MYHIRLVHDSHRQLMKFDQLGRKDAAVRITLHPTEVGTSGSSLRNELDQRMSADVILKAKNRGNLSGVEDKSPEVKKGNLLGEKEAAGHRGSRERNYDSSDRRNASRCACLTDKAEKIKTGMSLSSSVIKTARQVTSVIITVHRVHRIISSSYVIASSRSPVAHRGSACQRTRRREKGQEEKVEMMGEEKKEWRCPECAFYSPVGGWAAAGLCASRCRCADVAEEFNENKNRNALKGLIYVLNPSSTMAHAEALDVGGESHTRQTVRDLRGRDGESPIKAVIIAVSLLISPTTRDETGDRCNTALLMNMCTNGQDVKGVEEVPTIENVKINLEGLLAFTTHFIIISLKGTLGEENVTVILLDDIAPRLEIKTRVESSTLPDAGREIIQIRSSDALVASPQFHAHTYTSTKRRNRKHPHDEISVEREAAGNQETFKPQEHGLANVMLGGIIRLPCEECIFEQALSLELAMTLPINREVQSSRCIYWDVGEEVWQMDAFDQNSELEA
ncbi:hypothetical protein EDD85DRAFT_783058 [Armillaria nabsnona]|nr:hypothetical protein EDD85DRAFT_783058 [Armillaria nabsnona]